MSNDGTPGQPGQPQWDATNGEWVSGPYRWDEQSQQWLPRQASAPAAAAPASAEPAPAAATDSVAPAVGQDAAATSPVQDAAATSPMQDAAAASPVQDTAAPSAPYVAPAQTAAYGAAPAAAYGAPAQTAGEAAPGQKKGLGTGAIIGIIAGSVAVLAVIAIVIAMLVIPRTDPREAAAQSAAKVVQDYLTALADSDADAALALLVDTPSDATLLTDDALSASNDAAPIADISVPEPTPLASDDEYSHDITASYSIGGKPVSGTFSVVDYDGSGDWRLMSGTVDLFIGSGTGDLDITLNGEPVDGDSVTVFPGTYHLETTSPYHTLTGTDTVTVSDPADYSADFSDVNVELNEKGLAAFRQSITDAVTACLASKSLVAGCGIDIPETISDGTKIIDGTITRSLDADGQATMANLKPEDIYGDPMQVRGPYIGSVDVTADCESNGQRLTGCTFLFLPSFGSPLVDFTTDPVTVRWD